MCKSVLVQARAICSLANNLEQTVRSTNDSSFTWSLTKALADASFEISLR